MRNQQATQSSALAVALPPLTSPPETRTLLLGSRVAHDRPTSSVNWPQPTTCCSRSHKSLAAVQLSAVLLRDDATLERRVCEREKTSRTYVSAVPWLRREGALDVPTMDRVGSGSGPGCPGFSRQYLLTTLRARPRTRPLVRSEAEKGRMSQALSIALRPEILRLIFSCTGLCGIGFCWPAL